MDWCGRGRLRTWRFGHLRGVSNHVVHSRVWVLTIHSNALVKQESGERTLVIVSGFIHDVTSFVANHPGGKHLLELYAGKDATEAFSGGVYSHSNAAQNVCEKRSLIVFPIHSAH